MSQEKNLKSSNGAGKGDFTFVFGKLNYILLIIGIVVLAIGYILLTGGGSNDPKVFNPAMFDNRRLVAAPIFIVLGFIIEIFAIMLNPGKKDNQTEQKN
jgi:hypothetical protein